MGVLLKWEFQYLDTETKQMSASDGKGMIEQLTQEIHIEPPPPSASNEESNSTVIGNNINSCAENTQVCLIILRPR